MVDLALRRDVRRLVEESVPPTPWLEDRVMAAVIAASSSAVKTRPRAASLRLGAAFLATVVIGLLVVAALVGSRLGAHTLPAPATQGAPSRDSSVVRYSSLIAEDMYPIDSLFRKSFVCKTREACASNLAQTRTATERLLEDISTAPAPPSIGQAVEHVKVAAQEFKLQLDVAIALMQEPNSDYIAAMGATSINDLDLAVAGVHCWPMTPVAGHDGVTCS